MASSPPSSPLRSARNAEGEDAKAFYDKGSPNSAFNERAFFNSNAPGIIDDEEGSAGGVAHGGDLIDDGACPDESFRSDVERAVTFQRAQDGKQWHCSNVNSATRNDDGSCALGLVLCSGDLCTMKKFNVSPEGEVSIPASGGGMFSGF